MIIVNVSSVKVGRSGGSETLATNFITHLKKTNEKIIFVGSSDYLKSLNVNSKNCHEVFIKNYILRRLYVEYILLPLLVKKTGPRKVINFSNTCSPLIPRKLNLLVLLDANYRYHLGMTILKRKLLKFYVKFIATRAETLVTISNAAAQDLRKDIDRDIHVAYLGGSFKFVEKIKNDNMVDLNEKYILALSSLSTNKNIDWLVSNWSNDLPTLYLSGHGSEFYQTENVRGLGYASQDTLFNLFGNCEVFVFPSIYEGFGIPIVDCMNLNKPLVCSDINVFREIAGNYGTFFTLGSRESLIQSVLHELNNCSERVVPRSYSWESFTEKIMSLTRL